MLPLLKIPLKKWNAQVKNLDRGIAYYGILRGNMSTPEFRTIQTELAPLFSEFQSKDHSK